MKDENSKNRFLIRALSIIIGILLLAVLYLLVFQPQYSNFIENKRVEGAIAYENYIISQIQSTGYAQIPVGNQTLVLVPYVPQQTNTPENQSQ